MEGNISVGDLDIRPIVQAAHAHHVQVLLSLAGGALTPEWAAAWEILLQIQNRSGFISKLMDYVREYELEGIDVDLEWNYINENYSGFVLELRDSLDAEEKLLTAALPGTYRYPQVSDQAMHAFDFINMMAYDLTGPWNPSNPGPHAPYSFAVQAVQYWKSQGVPGEKLTLGVPFYGWDFTDPSNVAGFTYRSMVEQDPDYSQLNQVGQAYYNGIPTIEAKTRLALDQVSGVMIWELGQDAFNEYSLLPARHLILKIFEKTSFWPALALFILPAPQSIVTAQHSIRKLENPITAAYLKENLRKESPRLVLNKEIEENLKQELKTDPVVRNIYEGIKRNAESVFEQSIINLDLKRAPCSGSYPLGQRV